ncbi:alpha/beta fold hydrolase [Pararhodobacter marinus]|uniref:alpha/beta fold hydrolase n=1 Tax=Pararhodobacter marinus TaxID=2184063 RepID=UPI00351604AA
MSYRIERATLPGGAIDYHVAGMGKPVLYLHAAGGVAISQPMKALAQTHTVYAPVTPGFDGTEMLPGIDSVVTYAAFVGDFAEATLGARFDVIGSSFGSWVAMWLAVLRPDMVDHLILQVPAGFRFDGEGGLPDDPAARMKALYAHPDRITAPPKADAIMAANRQTYEAMAALPAGATVDEALSARLGDIRAVTLILQGTEDPVVPATAGAHLKRHIPVSQRCFVFDAAHAIESDQPDKVSRLWTEFLGRGQGFVLNRGAAA